MGAGLAGGSGSGSLGEVSQDIIRQTAYVYRLCFLAGRGAFALAGSGSGQQSETSVRILYDVHMRLAVAQYALCGAEDERRSSAGIGCGAVASTGVGAPHDRPVPSLDGCQMRLAVARRAIADDGNEVEGGGHSRSFPSVPTFRIMYLYQKIQTNSIKNAPCRGWGNRGRGGRRSRAVEAVPTRNQDSRSALSFPFLISCSSIVCEGS